MAAYLHDHHGRAESVRAGDPYTDAGILPEEHHDAWLIEERHRLGQWLEAAVSRPEPCSEYLTCKINKIIPMFMII